MNGFLKLSVSMALVLSSVLPALAGNLTVKIIDPDGIALPKATVNFSQGDVATSAVSGLFGKASFDAQKGTSFTVTVKLGGWDNCTFSRTIPNGQDWGTATVVMRHPASGTSYVGEWRLGKTSSNEDPEKDNAKFNFHVKYYANGVGICGASVVLTRLNGSIYTSLTTGLFGNASCLVKEGLVLTVSCTAAGYVPYTTTLAPSQKATSREVNIRLRK